MPVESSEIVELPQTYGELYSFMTVTGNGPFMAKRYEIMDGTSGFRENERLLTAALSHPDAAEGETRLPKELLKAAGLHLRLLQGKAETSGGIKARAGEILEDLRHRAGTLFARLRTTH